MESEYRLSDDIYLDSETIDSLYDQRITQFPPAERLNALRFGLAVTYDEMYGWRDWTQSLVHLLWTHLSMTNTRVVGWDILEYDLPVIRNCAHQPDVPVQTLDLSAEIEAATHRHYKLDSVARTNLGRGKIQDTQIVIGWLRAGDPYSMTRATEHCHNNVQLVYDLMALIQRGQPLLLPGRRQPDEEDTEWYKTKEATLRVYFAPRGEWLRCEDLHGKLIAERTTSHPALQ